MSGTDKTDRLRAVISAYGVDPARWPAGERPELRDAAQRHAEMHADLAHEAALDEILRADARPPDLPEGLRTRLLAAAPRAPARPVSRRVRGGGFALPAWLRAAGVAATLGLGAAAGYAGAAAAFAPAGPEQSLLGMAFSAPGDPFAALIEDEA